LEEADFFKRVNFLPPIVVEWRGLLQPVLLLLVLLLSHIATSMFTVKLKSVASTFASSSSDIEARESDATLCEWKSRKKDTALSYSSWLALAFSVVLVLALIVIAL
jgi:hypothetical protein